jgi:hypothetical protein
MILMPKLLRPSTLFLLLPLLTATAMAAGTAAPAGNDFSGIDLAKFGIPRIAPHPDHGTAFIIGGTNPTTVIRALTQINGMPLGTLEDRMRSGHASQDGFLGDKEKLLDVMAADNDLVVGKLGLSHAELARHLHAMGVIARQLKGGTGEFIYHGRRYYIIRAETHGRQDSPFDDGTSGDLNIVVANLDSGQKISYSVLSPFMIERYGFYEGKDSIYRLDPKAIAQVFDFIPPASGTGHVTVH